MANDTRGVFRLRTLRQENVEGKGVPLDDVWVDPPYGVASSYFAGGYVYVPGSDDSYYSIVDKLQFSSDSVARSPSADLDYGGYNRNPVASSTAAYWMSGQKNPSEFGPSSWTTKTSKTTYSTDTTASSPNFPHSGNALGWDDVGSTATETAGYTGGGMPTPMYSRSYLWKLDFSTDGFSFLPRFPQEQAQTGDALGNQTHGYWSGGIQKPSGSPNSYGAYTRVIRYTYSTDTFSEVGTLPAPRKQVAASGNATEGYIYGGIDGHPAPANEWTSTAIKLTYSTDTTSLNPSNLAQYPIGSGRGSGNLSNGYVVNAGSPGTNSNIFKFDYSTGTQSTPGSLKRPVTAAGVANASARSYGHPGKFSAERWTDGAVEIKANHGYFGMGFPSSGNGDFKKLDFDTETVSPNYQFYSPGRQQFAVGSSLTHGYNLGGAYQGGAKSNVYKWDYATNSGSENPSKLNRTRRQSNSSSTRTHGYVVGGYSDFPTPDGTKTDISKYSFTTDTSLGNITGNLSTTNQAGMGAGNQEFGYHTQGSGTIIWKLTYSTDTVSTLTAQLPVYRYEMTPSTMANATTAYFVGGSQGPGAKSSTDKMDYSTDTISAGSNLSNNAQRGQATSNTEVGYVMLGWNAPTSGGSIAVSQEVNKFDFATDTVTAKGGIFNHQPNTYSTALSIGMNNQSGLVPGPPEATPTLQKYYDAGGAGTSPNYGFYSSGNKSGGGWLADTIRIPFWTDSRSTVPSAGPGRINGQSVSSGLANYMVGGQTPTSYPGPALASYWKYTYSTTTNEQIPALLPNRDLGVPAGPANNRLSQAGQSSAGAYAGYLSGGNYPGSPDGGSVSTTSKLEYSDETSSLVPTASLPVRAAMAVGMGRANDQSVYMAGGDDNIPSPNVGRMSYVTKISHVTGTASNALNLPSPSSHSCGTENSSNGYFGLGQMPNAGGGASSQMFKLTYSSETMARMPGADSTSAGYTLSGKMVMASTSHGYFSGGTTAAGGSYTEKLNFSNDTMAGAPGAGLNYAVSGGMSFSPKENGIGNSAPQFNPVYV